MHLEGFAEKAALKRRDVSSVNLFNGNCLDVMRDSIASGSIDLVVTSPPYDDMREYQGYSFDFKPIADQLKRVIKPGGVIVWVVNDATVDGSETGSSFKQALYFKDIGLNLHDTMIYQKIPVPHDPDSNRYWQGFEYMFILSKGKPKTCNYIKIPCVGAGNRKATDYGTRRTDGTKRLDRYDDNRIVQDTKVKDNIWFYDIGSHHRVDGHPAQYQLQLASDHIQSWSNEGDLVLDPFMGSGTTGLASQTLKRRFVGIEISKEYFDLCDRRIRLGMT